MIQKMFTVLVSKSIDRDNLPVETLDDDENNDDDIIMNSKETIANGNQEKPKQCSKPRIIRSVWFNVKSQPEKHFRELIMLFTPWRNEETDLLANCSSYDERFLLYPMLIHSLQVMTYNIAEIYIN